MSHVRLVLRDAESNLSGVVHGGWADRAVAACSADQETLDELRVALARFANPASVDKFLKRLQPGLLDAAVDTGLIVVDLAARLVVFASDYSEPLTAGEVYYHNDAHETEVGLPFHLGVDWLMVINTADWRQLAEERRDWRAREPLLDAREVFYGRPLLEFIARNVAERIKGKGLATERDAPGVESALAAAVRGIHADWMLMPRADLGSRCPREIALERRDHISRDMQDRQKRWSRLEECPPGLDCSSRAYQYGGFGIHELVVYYDLVRDLLWTCVDHAGRAAPTTTTGDFIAVELQTLEAARDEWLDAPDLEYGGRMRRSIIERERRRLPEGGPCHETIVDPDCPCCQMLADLPGPMFWHLDGCNMDEDFAFDIYHKTCAEWEKEEREREEWRQRWKSEESERERQQSLNPEATSVWRSSFVTAAAADAPIEVRLFAISARLAELTGDLRVNVDNDENREATDQLNRDFGNLREVLLNAGPSTGAALIQPVIDRFVETLREIRDQRTDAAAKCNALADEIRAALQLSPSDVDFDDAILL